MKKLSDETGIPIKWVFALFGSFGFIGSTIVAITLYISKVDAKATEALEAKEDVKIMVKDIAEIKGMLKQMDRQHR